MPELTPAQKRKFAQREKEAAAVAEGGSASAPTDTVSLAVMLGEGGTVTLSGREYEVAAFPVARLAKAGQLLAECPELMLSAAMCAAEDGEVSAAKTAETLNRLMQSAQPGAEGVSPELMEYAFGTMAMAVTESQAAAMTPLVALALSRKHPGITAEEIEDDLDVETFFAVLCCIFRQNQALRKRF